MKIDVELILKYIIIVLFFLGTFIYSKVTGEWALFVIVVIISLLLVIGYIYYGIIVPYYEKNIDPYFEQIIDRYIGRVLEKGPLHSKLILYFFFGFVIGSLVYVVIFVILNLENEPMLNIIFPLQSSGNIDIVSWVDDSIFQGGVWGARILMLIVFVNHLLKRIKGSIKESMVNHPNYILCILLVLAPWFVPDDLFSDSIYTLTPNHMILNSGDFIYEWPEVRSITYKRYHKVTHYLVGGGPDNVRHYYGRGKIFVETKDGNIQEIEGTYNIFTGGIQSEVWQQHVSVYAPEITVKTITKRIDIYKNESFTDVYENPIYSPDVDTKK